MSNIGQIACTCVTDTSCCVALRTDPVDVAGNERAAARLKALGDPVRLTIVQLLAAAPGPVCVVDIERHVPLSQSTISHHLKTLVDAGVLVRQRHGRWSYYAVVQEAIDDCVQVLGHIGALDPERTTDASQVATAG